MVVLNYKLLRFTLRSLSQFITKRVSHLFAYKKPTRTSFQKFFDDFSIIFLQGNYLFACLCVNVCCTLLAFDPTPLLLSLPLAFNRM